MTCTSLGADTEVGTAGGACYATAADVQRFQLAKPSIISEQSPSRHAIPRRRHRRPRRSRPRRRLIFLQGRTGQSSNWWCTCPALRVQIR